MASNSKVNITVVNQENSTDIEDRYEYRKIVLIQGISTNTERQYRYRKSVRIQKYDTILENSSSTGFKFYTTIKIRIIIELSTIQEGMQANVYPSEAKQAGVRS